MLTVYLKSLKILQRSQILLLPQTQSQVFLNSVKGTPHIGEKSVIGDFSSSLTHHN